MAVSKADLRWFVEQLTFDIVAICAGSNNTYGLRMDGSIVSAGYNGGDQWDTKSWRDILPAVSCEDVTQEERLFNRGDLVQLKSVRAYQCVCFAGKNKESFMFDEQALIPYVKSEVKYT